MTTELKSTLAEHSAGNFRVMMNLCDELLTIGFERELPQLDEGLYFDVFHPQPVAPTTPPKKRRKRT